MMSTPWLPRMRCNRLTSASRGTLSRTSVWSVSRLAIISGSVAFFAPEIGIVPSRRRPPTMRMRSITTPPPRPVPDRPPPYPPPQAGEDSLMFPPPQAGEGREGALWTRRDEGAKRDAAQGYRPMHGRSPKAYSLPRLRRKSGVFGSILPASFGESSPGERPPARPRACALRRLRFSRSAARSRSPRAADFSDFSGFFAHVLLMRQIQSTLPAASQPSGSSPAMTACISAPAQWPTVS